MKKMYAQLIVRKHQMEEGKSRSLCIFGAQGSEAIDALLSRQCGTINENEYLLALCLSSFLPFSLCFHTTAASFSSNELLYLLIVHKVHR